MGRKPSVRRVVDTRTPYQFAEDARRRELGLRPIIRPGQPRIEAPPAAPSILEGKTAEAATTGRVETVDAPVPELPKPPSEALKTDPLVERGLKKIQNLNPRQLRYLRHLAENLTNSQMIEKENATESSVSATLTSIYKTFDIQHVKGRKGARRAVAVEIARLHFRSNG